MNEFKLSSGKTIPAIGFGTWRSMKNDAFESVLCALDLGYRHIDTAEIYANEIDVGKAIAQSSVAREEIFLTTKLWNEHRTAESARLALDQSLGNLGTDYLDLYLIHWPGSYQRIRAVWKAMEEAVDAGKVRSIGVSNFNVHHVDNLLDVAQIRPVVNQVECNPYLQNVFLNNYCRDNGIILEAYAPLNSSRAAELLQNEKLTSIASNYGRTVAQIVLRWHIQRGIVALPKSVTPSRIEENFQTFDFELSDEEMKMIRRLNTGTRHFPEPDNMDFGFAIE
jgi:methylglyoxal/glyoxal reductase